MDKEYIIRLIHEYNPELLDVPAFKRYLYREIVTWLRKKQIIAIVGLRRVGKTTLMKQLLKETSKSAYFSFDEEETQSKETLSFVIDYFLNNFYSKYIFLDEVHYINDWQGLLKRYYDTKNVKFIISGSESLDITKAKESLAGRIVTFKLEPLGFDEYLEIKNKIKKRDLSNIARIREFYYEFLTKKEFFEKEFLEYLYNGAFPEIIDEKDETIVRKYIGDLVTKKIIYRDIPRIFEIKRRNLLFEMFIYICNNSSNLFEIKNLCNLFNADYETINNYLFYLKSAYLIKISENYSGSIAKRLRRNKKIYVVHPSLAFAALNYKKEMLIEKILGQYVETVFAGEYFWRDKLKNEVDVVVKNRKILPIEIKYKKEIKKDDTRNLLRFMDKFNVELGIIVTRDIFKEEKREGKIIYYIPGWLFLLSSLRDSKS